MTKDKIIQQFYELKKIYQPDGYGKSTLTIFELMIEDKKWLKKDIRKYFLKLVDKEDYLGCNKEYLLEYCEKLSEGAFKKLKKK